MAITPDRLSSNMALEMQYFLLDGVGIRQIGGVTRDHSTVIKGDYPIRKLYRYYNEADNKKQTIAVCKNIISFRDNADDYYPAIGSHKTNVDSVIVTLNDSMVVGYNTNWVPMKGEHDGDGWVLTIGNYIYPIEKIYSANLLELADTTWTSGSTDTLPCRISIPGRSGYVDMCSFDNLLFIANGTDPVFRWDGVYLNHDYYIVDSCKFTNITGTSYPTCNIDANYPLQGVDWELDDKGRKTTEMYQDSGYCLIFSDTNTSVGYSKPYRIYEVDKTYPYNGDLKFIHIDPIMIDSGHFSTGEWCYITKPLYNGRSVNADISYNTDVSRYVIYTDTVYRGTVDSSYLDRDSTNNTNYYYIYDWDESFEENEFNTGAYYLKFINLDWNPIDAHVDSTFMYGVNFIGYNDANDSVGLRITTYTSGDDNDSNHFADDAEYIILRGYYYPRSQFVEGHNNRIWFANDPVSDDRIIYSDIQDPDVLKGDYGLNHFYTNKGDKSYINGFSSVSDRLRIYTNDGMYILIGADIYDFQMRKIFKYGIGVTSPYSLVSHGYTDFFFGSNDGIYSYNAVDSAPRYLCEAVQDIFLDSMNQDYSHKVQLGLFHDRMFVGYPDGADTNVSNGLVYDFDGFWSMLDSNKFCGGDYIVKDLEDDRDTVLFGGCDGFVYRYNISDLYVTSAIDAVYQTPWLDFGYPSMLKMISKVLVKYHKSDTAKIALWMYKDGSGTAFWTDTIEAGAEDCKYDQILLNVDPELGDRFSLKLQGIEADSLRITQIGFNVEYFRDDD